MVTSRKIYDFSDADNSAAAAQAARAGEHKNDFFIDGWDAYERWLDDVRDTVDAGDDG